MNFFFSDFILLSCRSFFFRVLQINSMKTNSNIIAVIPARYGSTRFPGKSLALIQGKPMIQWVYERTKRSQLIDRVLVATDDDRIMQAVAAFGGEAVMTSKDHPTGTDRIAEVAQGLDCGIIVNVQGDEPLIEPAMIDEAIGPLVDDATIPMGTVCKQIDRAEEAFDPNVVKVFLTNRVSRSCSRAPPYPGTGTPGRANGLSMSCL